MELSDGQEGQTRRLPPTRITLGRQASIRRSAFQCASGAEKPDMPAITGGFDNSLAHCLEPVKKIKKDLHRK